MLTGHWDDSKCHPWTASPDGSFISSGINKGLVEENLASRMVSLFKISKTLVRSGTITFQFKVEAEDLYDGLLFLIDTDVKMDLISDSNGWVEKTFNVSAGTHTFGWQYIKDYTGDYGADKAWIKSIVIEGTSYSDTRCHQCSSDMIQRGDSVCRFCKQNQYAGPSPNGGLEFVCNDCPPNMFAPEGSIGPDSCVARRPCQESDYNVNYTACSGGKRTGTYFWTEPKTCSDELAGAVQLPAPQNSIPCGTCGEGFYVGQGTKLSSYIGTYAHHFYRWIVYCLYGVRILEGGPCRCPFTMYQMCREYVSSSNAELWC